MPTLSLEIVTPEKLALREDVEEIILPGIDGELGILPHHLPLVTQLKPGELRIKKDNLWSSLAIGEGFVQVNKDSVKVLADLAARPEDISEGAVEEARKRAEEALKQKHILGEEEFAATAAALQKALAQLKVKRRHHPH